LSSAVKIADLKQYRTMLDSSSEEDEPADPRPQKNISREEEYDLHLRAEIIQCQY
jgi:hypothetical protein